MQVFGRRWAEHPDKLFAEWRRLVGPTDWVVIPGDISWAMHLEDALSDLALLDALPGYKLLLRGNHDYWWPTIHRLRSQLPASLRALQNDALAIGSWAVCGSRGWSCPGSEGFSAGDQKIYARELQRLRLSLEAARRLGLERLLLMLHFPPTNASLEPSGFTELIEEYQPDLVLHGHLHGVSRGRLISDWKGVPVRCVSADLLDFQPLLVIRNGALAEELTPGAAGPPT
jgi:predicted phosphohydrolase